MCAQFMIRGSARLIGEHFQARMAPELTHRDYEDRVVPFKPGLVVVRREGHRELREMRFHLTPRWSKEERVKWATYNARLDSIETKATFKAAFRENHCLVILNGFIEPIYKGDYAGYMVQFHRPDGLWMAAAGIFDQWVHPTTGEIVESFSIITDEPDEFVAKTGHDREPLFLRPDYFDEWLEPKKAKPEDLKGELRSHRANIELIADRDRAMRPGWEKRIPEE